MDEVEVIKAGPFPRIVIEDRTGERHEIEISEHTLDLLEHLGCDSCNRGWGMAP